MGKNILETKKYIFYYSCNDKQGNLGTGFLINKRAKTAIINFTPINGRLCGIRIRGKFRNYY